jgi:hypothetical protein
VFFDIVINQFVGDNLYPDCVISEWSKSYQNFVGHVLKKFSKKYSIESSKDIEKLNEVDSSKNSFSLFKARKIWIKNINIV